MKFKRLREGLEEYGFEMWITDSPFDVRNFIINKPYVYRILYDSRIDKWMICNGMNYIHRDMLLNAYKKVIIHHRKILLII